MLQSSQIDRAQKVQTTSVPAPIGGLNARDSIAAMPPTDAVTLDNYFCTPTSCDVRNGYIELTLGLLSAVETLVPYVGSTSDYNNNFLIAANSSKIYSVASGTAVEVATGKTNGRWQSINFGTAGGHYLYMVNGADKPQLFDGATFVSVDGASVPAITGVTTSLFIHVWAFKQRLWFTEVDSTRVWYLPVGSVGGAAKSIDFGSLLRLGGYIMGMTSFSVDNSNGMDEYAAFVSSEGEVLVYQGYDPTSASTWGLVSQFRIGRPVGRRFFTKMGSDVIMLTADGLTQMSKALLTDRTQLQDSISYKIVNSITADVAAYGTNFGWEIIYAPMGNKLIINVPTVEGTTTRQYVMNTITNTWSTWGKYNSQILANCWAYYNDSLYCGSAGRVLLADYADTDNGDPIVSLCNPAFQYFGALGREKYFTMARPIFFADGSITPSLVLNLDFSTNVPQAVTTYTVGNSLWDVSDWDVTAWGGSGQVRRNWQTVNGIGYAAALGIKLSTNYMSAKLQSIDYVYELGGIL